MHENYMLYFICSFCLYFLVSSVLPLYCSDVIIKQNVEILQTITKTNFDDNKYDQYVNAAVNDCLA